MRRSQSFTLFLFAFLLFCIPLYGESGNNSHSTNVDHENSYVDFHHDLPRIRIVDHKNGFQVKQFVRYGLCQMGFLNSTLDDRGLWEISDAEQRVADIERCVDVAVGENIDILIFPELSLNLPTDILNHTIEYLKEISLDHDMIIVGGSFYDEDRYQRTVIVGPGWIEFGYKYKPSRFEASPLSDEGMNNGEELIVLQTVYGDFTVIVCADLISDEIQYCVRRLATYSMIDSIIILSYNPSSWEFLIEANSIVRRHPVSIFLTNVFNCPESGEDNGYSFGHTSILSDLRNGSNNLPNSSSRLLELLPFPIVIYDSNGNAIERALPYSHVVADLGVQSEGMLICELNNLLHRVPRTTNAPDQGYPPVRGIKYIIFE